MKTQMISQMKPSHHDPKTTTSSWQRLLAIVLMMSALLLAGSIAVHAQSPPSTYTAQTPDGFGPPGEPATMVTGSNGAWSFDASLPVAYQYQSRNIYYDFWWSYDYYSGGSFTLGDGSDTFTGTFTSGYGYGSGEEGGPFAQQLTLDMYFTGEWNTGLKQAGLMHLFEFTSLDQINGTATLNFGPAPEPSSFLLFGSGIVGLAGLLRRKLMG